MTTSVTVQPHAREGYDVLVIALDRFPTRFQVLRRFTAHERVAQEFDATTTRTILVTEAPQGAVVERLALELEAAKPIPTAGIPSDVTSEPKESVHNDKVETTAGLTRD